MAFRLIHSSGLDAYYSMVESGEEASLTQRALGGGPADFDEFDQPTFLARFGKSNSETEGPHDFNEIVLLLDGIHCAACIWLIEKLPQIVPGVSDVKLNWARQTAQIRWRPEQVKLSKIAQSLYQLGYTPHPIRENEIETLRKIENRRHLMRIGIAAAAAGNNMLIAASLYFGMFSYMSGGMTQLLRVASCLVGLASLAWPGRIFLRGAIAALRTKTPHMDLPIALGLTVGSLAGIVNTIRGSGEIYFDSLSVLIFLLLVGRWVQFRQQNRAADSVEMLYRLTPKTTRKIVDGHPVETYVDLVQAGDLLEIRNGDLVPVDAEIVRGQTQMDESILSGESRLLKKSVGDTVLAGTQNKSTAIEVRTTATGNDTRLSKIIGLVEQAALDKPKIVQWANHIGGIFVVSIIVMAFLTLFAWLWIEPAVAVDRAVALLIVACPCALALATPLAVSVALGRAAKRKIMIKGGDVLQHLDRPGMIWLDKTGTLTLGDMEVKRWYGDTQFQSFMAGIESKSSHPVAQSIVKFVNRNEIGSAEEDWSHLIDQAREVDGQGMIAEGPKIRVLIGNAKLLEAFSVQVSHRHQQLVDRILDSGFAPCWIVVNGTVNAILSVGDQLRGDTESAIKKLKHAGWEVGVLSGDHQKVVDLVSTRLGIASTLAVGGASPEQKVKLVSASMQQYPTVVMVGDGVNDSAALAAASVGIAVHNGAEASLAAAPVYLAEEGLQPILKLLQISKSTNRTIRRNFVASLSYNILGATLAALGWINPLVAAILMPISSLTVVTISLTAGRNLSTKDTNQ
ncbi:MAG: Cu2+-exporting ATPase [Mariniblastus sp.]|jgi:Cu2+-exporting ATPase